MANHKYLIFALVLLCLSQCSSPGHKNFILGTWEGRARVNGKDNHLAMHLTFKGGLLTADYSPDSDAVFSAPYEFTDERTIKTALFPKDLIIEKHSDAEISFRPAGGAREEGLDMVYACRFVKVKN
jgi:hypothetical protein